MRVTHAIESVKGVRYARVDFPNKSAEVEADSCSDQVFEQISQALDTEGYGGTVVSVEPLPSAPSGPSPRPAEEAL